MLAPLTLELGYFAFLFLLLVCYVPLFWLFLMPDSPCIESSPLLSAVLLRRSFSSYKNSAALNSWDFFKWPLWFFLFRGELISWLLSLGGATFVAWVASVRNEADWFAKRGLLKVNEESSAALPCMNDVGFIFSFSRYFMSLFLETLEDVLSLAPEFLVGILNIYFILFYYNSKFSQSLDRKCFWYLIVNAKFIWIWI